MSETSSGNQTTQQAEKRPEEKAVTISKSPEGTVERNTMQYISHLPQTIPVGKILCHGGVIPKTADQKPGVNGFRPWVDDEGQIENYGPCNCGWSGLDHHMPLAWLEDARKEYDARNFPRE